MPTYSIFSAVVRPGHRVRIVPVGDVRLTIATFSETLESETGRSTIKLYQTAVPEDDEESSDDDDSDDDEAEKEPTFEKEPLILAHLTPGRVSLTHFRLRSLCRFAVDRLSASLLDRDPGPGSDVHGGRAR